MPTNQWRLRWRGRKIQCPRRETMASAVAASAFPQLHRWQHCRYDNKRRAVSSPDRLALLCCLVPRTVAVRNAQTPTGWLENKNGLAGGPGRPGRPIGSGRWRLCWLPGSWRCRSPTRRCVVLSSWTTELVVMWALRGKRKKRSNRIFHLHENQSKVRCLNQSINRSS